MKSFEIIAISRFLSGFSGQLIDFYVPREPITPQNTISMDILIWTAEWRRPRPFDHVLSRYNIFLGIKAILQVQIAEPSCKQTVARRTYFKHSSGIFHSSFKRRTYRHKLSSAILKFIVCLNYSPARREVLRRKNKPRAAITRMNTAVG